MTARNARRALALGVLLAAALGFGVDEASASYKAQVVAGTLHVTGNGASDTLALRLEPGSPDTLQVDVGGDGTADFTFDRTTFTAIDVEAGGGDDEVRIDQSGGTFTDEDVTIDGGGGGDTLVGGAGAERFLGGPGTDSVDGNQGADLAQLGGGDDRFQWDPGDGSDTVGGQAGSDVLAFNGSNIGEQIAVAANGDRARLTRDVASIVMELDGVDRIDLRVLGGSDVVTVGSLVGTDLKLVDVDLDAIGGGDGQADSVVAQGTDGPDSVSFASPDGRPVVTGLGAQTRITGGEAALDDLVAATLGDADTATFALGVTSPIPLHVDGGDGDDEATYRGTPGADEIAVVADGAEVAVANASSALFETLAVESVVVSGLDGEDTISGTGNLAALTALTFEGGDGEDTLRGGNGTDLLDGGRGNDLVDGNQGADRALLGAGDDRFQWDPGDGSDTVEGQGGADELDFNGSNAGEKIELSANGERARLTRDIAAITMDLDGVERANVRTLGATDTVTVDDLAGTALRTVDADLSAFDGSPDGQADAVVARGTEGADRITLSSPGAFPVIEGLFARIVVEGQDLASDDVNVEALGGDDTITTGREVFGTASYNVDGGAGADVVRYNGTSVDDEVQVVPNGTEVSVASPLASRLDTTAVESVVVAGLEGADTLSASNGLATLTSLTLDGGPGEDTLLGGDGADTLLGGDGNDLVDGNRGNDAAQLGAGDDRFQWDPGDGSDTVEGQDGVDRLDFNGSNIGEQIGIAADGRRARLTRDIAAITMDFDLEAVAVRTLGGADTVTVGDLAGSNLKTVDVDLSSSVATGDGSADTVVVDGTARPDSVQVTRSALQVLVDGLPAQTRIAGGEAALDTLRIQTGAGNDDVTVAPDVADLITTVVDLGADD